MLQIFKLVSSLTSSLLASIRFVAAVDLALLLVWTLGEITYNVWSDAKYWPLALLTGFTLLLILGVTIWRCSKPESFGLATSAESSLKIVQLALLDALLVVATVFVFEQVKRPLTTPLLHVFQTMIHKFTS